MKIAIGLLLLAALFVGLPIGMRWCLREMYGSKPRSPLMVALGHAFEDLDRLVARPAIEQKLDIESGAAVQDNHNGD